MKVTTYLCDRCRRVVNPPGQMGRSWCSECEDYLVPVAIVQVRTADHKLVSAP